MSSQDATTKVLKALADDIRLGVVRKLAATPDSAAKSCDLVSSCASFLELSQPTMSHHLAKLVDAGVLVEEKHGVSKRYQLDREYLAGLGIDASKL